MKHLENERCDCDNCLLIMIKNGESSLGFLGWSMWYERDYQPVYRFALRRLGRWGMAHFAEDIVQDAFLIGWRNVVTGRFKKSSKSLTAYLMGVVKNLIRDRLRKTFKEIGDVEDEHPSKELTVEQGLVIKEYAYFIVTGLSCLEPKQKAVLCATYALGKKSAEVANELGITPENARITAMRGLQSIQRSVEDHFGTALSTQTIRIGLGCLPITFDEI